MRRSRVDYMVTVYVESRPEPQSWLVSALDAFDAVRKARRDCRGAVAVEVRRSGSSVVCHVWGQGIRRTA